MSFSRIYVVLLNVAIFACETHALDVTTIVTSDMQVAGSIRPDGTLGGLRESHLESPRLGMLIRDYQVNDRGQVAFSTYGARARQDHGAVWLWDNGALTRLAATTDYDAFSPYLTIYDVAAGGVNLSPNGEVLIGGVTNEATPRQFLKSINGSFEIHESDAAPGTENGVVFGFNPSFISYTYRDNPFTNIDTNNQGERAFFSLLDGQGITADNDESFWSTAGGSLHLVIREGQSLPTFGSQATVGAFTVQFGEQLDSFNRSRMISIDNQGASWLTVPILNGTVPRATFRASATGSLEPLIYDGAQAAPGLTFAGAAEFGEFSVSSTGESLFYAAFRRGSDAPKTGLWNFDGNEFHLLAEFPGPVPGLPSGTHFSQTISDFLVSPNSHGEYIFTAPLTVNGTPADSLWSGSGGDAALLVLEGSNAPGIPGGATLATLDSPVGLTDNGHIVFRAGFRALSNPSVVRQGFWLLSPQGELKLIAAEGLPIEVAPGDIRTIAQFGLGRVSPHYLSNSMFAFHVRFADQSTGIFAISLVPEPSSVVLVGFGVLVLFRRSPL